LCLLLYFAAFHPFHFVDLYALWFGHNYVSLRDKMEWGVTGECTIESIKQIPEARTATHLILFEQIPPDVHLLFPQVVHLTIKWPQLSSLQK